MTTASARRSATFGPFTLVPSQQRLLDGEAPVRLGGRAMALLCALVDRAGEVLSRDELVAQVWPSTVVEETSLRVHVSALRKVLGEGQGDGRYIVNVVGRGYSFVAPVAWHGEAPVAHDAPPAGPRHNLPTRLTRIVGRDETVKTLCEQVVRRPLLSIVGPGGIGKTVVSLSVAEVALASFEHGAAFVDLAPVTNAGEVGAALAVALGVAVPPNDSLPMLRAFLRERRMLLVFDNCEHVAEAVAQLCVRLLTAAPGLHLLTTSREPLNVEGEWVHRLAALDTPKPTGPLSVAEALGYSAVGLFVERAMGNDDSFVLTAANLPAVRQVCNRLDGMPLAIELAAARVASLGVQGLAERLDSVFSVLTRGRRTAEPRHRAMSAVFDWSHALLDDGERTVLRRLSVFRAAFTLAAAVRVVADERLDAAAVTDHLLSLVDKSLVTVNAGGEVAHYRLLYATRKFAELQLLAHDETSMLMRRHAEYFRDEFGAINMWQLGLGRLIEFIHFTLDDVNAAMDWAFSVPETAAIGAELLSSSSHYYAGSIDAKLVRFERAIEHLVRLSPPTPKLEREIYMGWVLHSGMSNAHGLAHADIAARLLALHDGAELRFRMTSFQALSVGAFGQGDYPESLRFGDEMAAFVEEPMATRQAKRMRALNLHMAGEHRQARVLTQALVDEDLSHASAMFQDSARRSFSMRLVMARILWMQGEVDQATVMAEAALEESRAAHPFAQCKAIGFASIPVALWRGDLASAESLNRRLRALADEHALGYWQTWVANHDRIIEARRAGVPVNLSIEHEIARGLPARNPGELDVLATFGDELLTEQALARVERGVVGWCAPEVLRAEGARVLRDGGPASAAQAEALFDRSLQLARHQGALSWELRSACSLARLWHAQGRTAPAGELLASTTSRFTEGHATADLVAARLLLDGMAVA